MKPWIILPFALLAGLVIGGWAPKTQLQAAKDDAKTAREELAKANKTGGMSGVTRLLGIQNTKTETSSSSNKKKRRPRKEDKKSEKDNPKDDNSHTDSEKPESKKDSDEELSDRERTKRQIEKAAELWRVRSDVARSSFINDAKLEEQDIAQFDVLVEAMNLRLGDRIDKFVDSAEQTEKIRAEDGVRFYNELSGIIVNTYDEMDRTMDEGWREDSSDEFQMLDFIDPSVATPLIDVQDKIEMGRPRDTNL